MRFVCNNRHCHQTGRNCPCFWMTNISVSSTFDIQYKVFYSPLAPLSGLYYSHDRR